MLPDWLMTLTYVPETGFPPVSDSPVLDSENDGNGPVDHLSCRPAFPTGEETAQKSYAFSGNECSALSVLISLVIWGGSRPPTFAAVAGPAAVECVGTHWSTGHFATSRKALLAAVFDWPTGDRVSTAIIRPKATERPRNGPRVPRGSNENCSSHSAKFARSARPRGSCSFWLRSPALRTSRGTGAGLAQSRARCATRRPDPSTDGRSVSWRFPRRPVQLSPEKQTGGWRGRLSCRELLGRSVPARSRWAAEPCCSPPRKNSIFHRSRRRAAAPVAEGRARTKKQVPN